MNHLLPKKFFKVLFVLICSFGAISAFGQKNIAPLATLATNVFSNTTYPPEGTNNKIINTCGTQETWFNWAPGGVNPYLEWDWGTVKTVNKMIIYHGQTTGRFLNGATIERWTGSAWVSHYTFGSLTVQCENTISFPALSASKMRITTWTLASVGQYSNPNFREIEIYEISAPLNAAMSMMTQPSNICSSPQRVEASLINAGTNRIDSAMVYWEVNGTAQTPVAYNKYPNFKLSDTLAAGQSKAIVFNASMTLADYTDYNFKFWSSMPNGKADTVNQDDTLRSILKFMGSPKNPTTTDIRRCGVGVVDLKATPGDSKDIILWWDKSSGGTSIGEGHTIKSPFLYQNTTYYAEAIRGGQVTTHKNGFNGGTIVTGDLTTYNGAMFDLTTGVSALLLDSLSFRLWQNITGSTYELYYREGGFNGYTTNASAWTKLSSGVGKFHLATEGNILTVENLKMILKPNTVYGFYFTTEPTTGNDIYLNSGNTAYNNGDMSFQGGTCHWGLFGSVGTYTTWSIDVRAGYRKTCPSSGRTKLDVEIVPLATGANLNQGSTFNGVYRAGTEPGPDYASEGRTISYELQPPTKFTNSEFGTKWYISSLSMGTINGTPIPTGDTTMSMPGASNGKMSYTPSWGWADSTIRIVVNLFDVSTGCDTTLVRYIFIAPTPRTSFEVKNGCLGTPLEFFNKTTISSGFVTYKWDFGDGNSSDFESPIHNYANHGKYKVKLTATSNLGISKDTIIDIEVFEIPDVKFDVLNSCEGTAVRFTNKTTISSGTLAFKWTFGDGQSSTAQSPTHLYAQAGGYKVTLDASANGCSNSLTKNAAQFAKPKANFTYTGECALKEMVFTNTSTIALGEKIGTMWNFGDGDRGTVVLNRHTFLTSGTKSVKLYAISQFGCTDSISKNVIVKPSPVADFTYDKVCDVDPVNFTNTSNEPSGITTIYSWTFGDGGISTVKNPTHKYNTLGPKVINMVATGSNGCFTDISKQVEVLVQPVADFTVQNGCSGEPLQFVNKSKVSAGEIVYKWYFGDGDSSGVTAPIKVYNPSGAATYTAVLQAGVNGGCTDVITKTVDIRETPTCGFTAVKDPNNRARWTFTPNNTTYGSGAYIWIFEGSGQSTDVVATHTFDYVNTRYRVMLTVTTPDGCDCIDSSNYITTDWGVGVEGLQKGGVQIYPNPSNGMITIAMDKEAETGAKVEVMDAAGRVVRSAEMIGKEMKMDLSDAAEGLYQVRVISATSISTGRIFIRN